MRRRHNGALAEQRIECRAHLLDTTAAVVAHVNDKRLCAAVGQRLQRRLELIGAAVMEILDADVADFIISAFCPMPSSA